MDRLAGLRSAREGELAARHAARGHIRDAREAGHSWHDISLAMDIVPGGDAQQAGDTIAEAACAYAAGNPDTQRARRHGRSISWTCGTCDYANRRPRARQRAS